MTNKIILFIIVSISFSILSFTPNDTVNWKKYKTVDGVSILHKIAKCTKQHNSTQSDYFVFKYFNSNDFDVRISYKIEYWIGEQCRSCNLSSPNEYEISIDIKAGQTLEYTCNDDNNGFRLYKSVTGGDIENLIKFNFTNIQIQKI